MKGIVAFFLAGVVVAAFGTNAWPAEPKVSVEIDKDQVVLGDSIRLTITAEGETPKSPPELPQIADFDVRYLGSRTESFSSFTVVIQGQKKEEHHSGGGTQFEYTLVPKKLGSFTIPRFSFTIDGVPYQTSEAYSIVVTDLPENSENIFLKVSADKDTVYLGESLLVTFEWYFDKDVQDYSLTIPWYGALKEFLVEDPKPDTSRQYAQLIINDKERVAAEKKGAIFQGKRYTVLSFQKILTPISAGSYTLEPSFVRAEVVKGYEAPQTKRVPFFRYYSDFEDLFGGRRRPVTEQALTRSKPLTLTVKPLPERNKPAAFTGAVGSFDFQVSVTPESVQKGEPVTVAMKVVGAGNFNEVQIPDFPELSSFKGYTPEIKSDTSTTDGMAIGEKTFTKVLVGRREGKYEIPPLSFSFFDPEKEMYQTIARGPFPIEVKPGSSQEEPPQLTVTESAPARRGKEVKVITQDIRYIKTGLGEIRRGAPPLYKLPLFLFFGFLPLPLVTALSFVIQKRRERFQTDVAYARRSQAFRNAEKMLQTSADPPKILTRFLADKLNQPIGTLPHELLEILKMRELDPALTTELKEFFDRIEVVKYSKATGDAGEMNALLGKTKELLGRLEKAL